MVASDLPLPPPTVWPNTPPTSAPNKAPPPLERGCCTTVSLLQIWRGTPTCCTMGVAEMTLPISWAAHSPAVPASSVQRMIFFMI